MNWIDSVNFLSKYFLLYSIIVYIICLIKLMIYKYNSIGLEKYLSLGEQSKLIKNFSERYLDVKKDQEKLLREIYAQQLTTYPNVSARFVAYCIRRELPNLNFIFYLFNISHALVDVIDGRGEYSLHLKCKKSVLWPTFILGNVILIIYAIGVVLYLSLNLTSGLWVFSNILINIVIVCLAIFLYKVLCFILLVAQLDDVVYKDLSKPNKTCYISWCSCLFDTICCRNRKQKMSAFKILKELEFKQLQHDNCYHKDIWVLNTQDKARHMAAHIGKYCGQLLEAIRINQDEEIIKKKLIDSLIINLSYANIFLCLVSDQLRDNSVTDQTSLDQLIHSVGQDYISQQKYEESENCCLELAMDLCILSGRVLKTVESMDHMERHPYRENFESYSLSIFKILSALCKKYDIKEIDKEIAKRLFAVEEKNPYFSSLGNYKEGYLR
ncbi:hypothetical protein [Acinetobacter sp. WCHA45]|uniref:hypothetical protein n=1 Tax=Acinetobacter sp. WCHA45 TaxID=2004644 RepID=UPI000B3D228D|nr:hypothetical protein [Acinetobacter sp. WCHA45]AVZ84668.1 hypothetical protein CDG55_02145 [Acinetobacter sp. WCHA45]